MCVWGWSRDGDASEHVAWWEEGEGEGAGMQGGGEVDWRREGRVTYVVLREGAVGVFSEEGEAVLEANGVGEEGVAVVGHLGFEALQGVCERAAC